MGFIRNFLVSESHGYGLERAIGIRKDHQSMRYAGAEIITRIAEPFDGRDR
jgi:hypothetical protein